jgi:hypothetical protein
MPIGEIIKVVSEAAKEVSKEASKGEKKTLKTLDKPLNTSEIKETEFFEEDDFDSWLKDLDKPLNAETESKDIPETETEPDAQTEEMQDSADNMQQDTAEKTNPNGQEIDSSEVSGKQGGRFGDIFKEGEGDTVEVHHMPADSVTELPRNDGPAIRMDKADHRETASCGNSREAREYRERQKELIDDGKFDEAVQMDIDDIHEKFGDKYDDAINEMLEYIDELKEEGKI